MRKLVAIAVFVLALAAAAPALAADSHRARITINVPVGLPVTLPASDTVPPPGFTSTANQAVAAAEASREMQEVHRLQHPLDYAVRVFDHKHWFIVFVYKNKVVAQVDVSAAGVVTHVWTGPLATATYARVGYSRLFDSPWVVIPFSLLFLVPFLDVRRLRRLLHLDALALLSLMVSYYLFDNQHLEAAVWAVYPPLLYLLWRMVRLGMRGSGSSRGFSSGLSMRALGAGLLVLMLARTGLSLFSRDVIDVGYVSVVGAHRITHGQSLYYAAAAHGDTYGPIAYLAYVPFELIFPFRGAWNYLPAAHAASIVFDLVTVAGLVALGRRLRSGREGIRLGLALGWAWAACPFTLLGLMMHTNDGLIAMLAVHSLLVFASPVGRGALLGLAAAAKFSPAALLPLYASHRSGGPRATIKSALAFAVVVVAAIVPFLPSGGLSEFYDHTLGYQFSRADVFSPWALHPGLDPIKVLAAVAALGLAALVAFVPRDRSLVRVSALAAAVTIAVQVPAVHWFYYYVIWFMPFVLIALLAVQSAPVDSSGQTGDAREPVAHAAEHEEPVFARA